MKLFYFCLFSVILLASCKKDKDEPPEAFRGKYYGEFYVDKGGISYNLSNVSFRFEGYRYDFGVSEVVDYPEYSHLGKEFFLTAPDKITFKLLLPTAQQLNRQYVYTIKPDSLILINTISPTEREIFRLKRAR